MIFSELKTKSIDSTIDSHLISLAAPINLLLANIFLPTKQKIWASLWVGIDEIFQWFCFSVSRFACFFQELSQPTLFILKIRICNSKFSLLAVLVHTPISRLHLQPLPLHHKLQQGCYILPEYLDDMGYILARVSLFSSWCNSSAFGFGGTLFEKGSCCFVFVA